MIRGVHAISCKVGAGALLVALVPLGACTLGPRYRPPVLAEGAEAPLISLKATAETNAEPPDDWWRLYHDALLDQLLKEAFAANTDLKVAEANLSAARAVLEQAKARRYPQTAIEAGGIYGRDPTTDEILELGGQRPENTWIFDTLLDVSYEVDLFGRVRRSVEAAHADTETDIAARDAVKITVAAETARAYAQICTLGAQIAVARHSLEVVSQEAQIAMKRHEAGSNSEFDVIRAQGLVAQVRSNIPPLEGQRKAALFELAALLGRTPSHAPTSAEACTTAPHLDTLVPVGDGAALLKRRPDVRQAERRVAAATARIGVATADLYPRISLTGFIGGVSATLPNLTTNDARAWGLGPSIIWSFPNQAAPRARLRQAKASATAQLAGFDAAVLRALKETEQSLAAYGAELDRRQALADAQHLATRAFALADDQFRAGAITYLDLLTTEQSLVSADAAVAASNAALVQDQISLFKALGGGWRSRPAVAFMPEAVSVPPRPP
ncbi:MAG TPA: efflux transporter outer membrane subunit [Steroidobacteraceae bacterium]|nr:efflux transporter outer membrane subunit [Steroidobacteraceae bacterium]